MDLLHATINKASRMSSAMTRLKPISWLPRISMGLTIAQLSARLRCAERGGQVYSEFIAR
jgi:hypothetical protein